MLKGSSKALILDLLTLVDSGNHESNEEIERKTRGGNLTEYLLKKYEMPCFEKTNAKELNGFVMEKIGCYEMIHKNGLLSLIEMLLDY